MAEDVNIIGEALRLLTKIEQGVNGASSFGGGAQRGARGREPIARQRRTGDTNDRIFTATTRNVEELGDAANATSGKLYKLGRTVNTTRESFITMNKSLRVVNSTTRSLNFSNVPALVNQGSVAAQQGIQQLVSSLGGRGGRSVPSLIRNLGSSTSLASAAIVAAAARLTGVLADVTDDFFMLQARGIDAASSLGGLYLDAASFGMSLDEYTKALESSTPALLRAANFAEFADTLRQSNAQLRGLGVFGTQATKLSATMANSATVLGIPQEELNKTITRQIEVFDHLRKTSLMTADGFSKIIAELTAMDEVQENLLGLGREERSARLIELAQIQTLGQSLGGTKEASDALGKAIIEQRKATAQDRFKAAGVARQAGAILGMSAADIEAYAMARRAKNPTLEQAEIIARVGGQMESALQRMENSGNFNQEFIAEQLRERMGGSAAALTAAGRVQLTAESGVIQQREINKHTGQTAQSVGLILQTLQGWGKNPIGTAISQAVGALGALGLGALGLSYARSRFGNTAGGGGAGTGGGQPRPAAPSRAPTTTPNWTTSLGANAPATTRPAPPNWTTSLGADGSGGVVKNQTRIIDTIMKPFRAVSSALTGLAASAKTAASSGSVITGAISKTQGIFSAIINGFKSFGRFFSNLIGIGSDTLNVLGRGASIFGRMLRFIPVIGTVLTFLYDTIGELFTGKVTSAFNPNGGGWVERIGNAFYSGITSIIGGFFSIIDNVAGDAVNRVGELFGVKGLKLENLWDRFAVTMRQGLMEALATIIKAIPFVGDQAAAYFQEAADASKEVLAKLQADASSTVSSIGEANQQKAESEKKAAEATKKHAQAINASAGVLTSTRNLAPTLVESAARVAIPGPTPRPQVVVPTVNTPTTPTTGTGTETTANQPAGATLTTPDLATQLETMIGVLRQMLAAESAQSTAVERLASSVGRPIFSDTTTLVNSAILGPFAG